MPGPLVEQNLNRLSPNWEDAMALGDALLPEIRSRNGKHA